MSNVERRAEPDRFFPIRHSTFSVRHSTFVSPPLIELAPVAGGPPATAACHSAAPLTASNRTHRTHRTYRTRRPNPSYPSYPSYRSYRCRGWLACRRESPTLTAPSRAPLYLLRRNARPRSSVPRPAQAVWHLTPHRISTCVDETFLRETLRNAPRTLRARSPVGSLVVVLG